MTQEKINEFFDTDLGQQCHSLFVTSDDAVFIRYDEAMAHVLIKGLGEKAPIEWFPEHV
jgi:hypothetical protein